MDTLDYLKNRRKQKCQYQPTELNLKLYEKLGKILSRNQTERELMDIDKPDLVLLPHHELDFIF